METLNGVAPLGRGCVALANEATASITSAAAAMANGSIVLFLIDM
jgi:hypothetical protein